MNTKTDQISSGLVALAWLDSNADMSDEAFLWDKDSSTGHVEAVVRLSDAEAIIAAKDAEIESSRRTAEYWKANHLSGNELIEQQSAALKLASLALSEGVEYVEEPPEKNCTCHLEPPCNDCVEHSAVREFFIDARKAIAAIDALGE